MSQERLPEMESTPASPGKELRQPSFAKAFCFWLLLGFISFGGPAGQIAIMQRELVERRRWIEQERFLHALNFCVLLPGPEAQQLAIYLGWLLHRTRGGVAAGVLFVLPSAFLLWLLSWLYLVLGRTPWIAAAVYGLKPAVIAIVFAAVLRLGRKALRDGFRWGVAGLAFIGLLIFRVPYPLIILSAALAGFIRGRLRRMEVIQDPGAGSGVEENGVPLRVRPTLRRTARMAATCLLIWWLPVALLGWCLGRENAAFRESLFFSKAALVTFGGAYAVLPYVARQAVEQYHWLTAGQMLDGLGLAETTPGPLIMVLQFIGFVGGWNHPGSLSPLWSATLGAAVTTWVTFTPCFLYVLVGAPYLEHLRGRRSLQAALSAITAAVVGVILNLACWFAWHTIRPATGVVDWFALTAAVVALIGLTRWRWQVVAVVLGGMAAGLLRRLLT